MSQGIVLEQGRIVNTPHYQADAIEARRLLAYTKESDQCLSNKTGTKAVSLAKVTNVVITPRSVAHHG